jgi:hypothetical protein
MFPEPDPVAATMLQFEQTIRGWWSRNLYAVVAFADNPAQAPRQSRDAKVRSPM